MLFLLFFLFPYLGYAGTIAVGVLCALAYYARKIYKKQQHWKNKKVKHLEPKFFFGNMPAGNSKALATHLVDLYQHYPDERYYGLYQFSQPVLVLRDPELIKQITVKEFDHFSDRHLFVNSSVDKYWHGNLLVSQGQRWKDLRSTLSPAFTSSKMKAMYGLIEDIAKQFVQHYTEKTVVYQSAHAGNVVEVEMKETMRLFANDVIATTAFGLKVNSFEDNEFYDKVKEIITFRKFAFFVLSANRKLGELLGFTVVPQKPAKYFEGIIKETVRVRKEHKIHRPDMINLLMEAQKSGLQHEENESKVNEGFSTVEESRVHKSHKRIEITDDDLVAQALLFFFAGYDTITTQTQFVFYELAKHPEIQQRLKQEIDSIEPNYENILGLNYLDMVISETLRKWPAALLTDRQVTKKFTIEPVNKDEPVLNLEVGDVVWVIIGGIHRDPNYYPDPMRFDPERFSDENKHNINPTMYLPFGAGPRNCIGSRFALLEIKLLTYYVIKQFEVVVTEKTPDPIVYDSKVINPTVKGGLWLGFKQR